MTHRSFFITGGSGFVGRNVIRALVARGDRAVALARSESAIDAVADLGAEAAPGDLGDVEAMAAAMRGCAAVFHAAAKVEQWGPRRDFVAINIEGTQNVIEAARRAGVPRLVHVGTEAALVGERALVRADETFPYPQRELGLYPWSKREAEKRVLAANGPDLTTVAVRPRLIWGRDDTSLLPQIEAAVRAGRFMWFGGGRYLSSTCHVDNVVEGMLLAADRGHGGEAYFLTDGPPVDFREFLTRMLRTRGVEPKDRNLPIWLARVIAAASEGIWRFFRLRGEPPLTRTALELLGREVTVDDSKARRELGYEGRVSVEQGLRDMELR